MKNKIIKIILSNPTLINLSLFFFKRKVKKKHQVSFGRNTIVGFSTIFKGRNYIGNESVLRNSEIGYASYISDYSVFKNTKIGKYCSIGPNVKVVFGKHPSKDFVSTHPSFFSTRKQVGFSYTNKQLFKEFADFRDTEKKYSIVIENDVWIGAGVMIMDGVKIGNGAIVAAGSVVVKDVEPYTIVGGVPAKIIKNRFSSKEIDFLLEFKWWDKETNWLKKNSSIFNDVSHFMKTFNNAK